jgi:hypothetical protein
MRKLWIAAEALLCSSVTLDASAADDWWMESDKGLPALVAEGYAVVGFSAAPDSNRMMNTTAYRFVLQKDASVFTCVEKIAGDKAMVTTCYELVAP